MAVLADREGKKERDGGGSGCYHSHALAVPHLAPPLRRECLRYRTVCAARMAKSRSGQCNERS